MADPPCPHCGTETVWSMGEGWCPKCGRDYHEPSKTKMPVCRYCDDTGLSIFCGSNMTLSICTAPNCKVGPRIADFLRLIAKLPPEKHEEVKQEIKRIVEA